MTHNIDLGEKEITVNPNNKAKGAQYRAAVTPLMNEIYKDFADAPKSQAFVKNLDETEAAIGLLSKKVDVLKKIQESHSERISVTSISKLSKLMDKLIIATLKNEPLDTDSDLVLSTVKKELQALKSEVTKLKKTNSSESRTFKF